MAKRDNFMMGKHQTNNLFDIDFHDFMELVESGYSTNEIARELGVSKREVNILRNEINKEY